MPQLRGNEPILGLNRKGRGGDAYEERKEATNQIGHRGNKKLKTLFFGAKEVPIRT
jgi:hypothetical protein